MATIKLGSAPKSIKQLITVDLLDGSVGTIECLFKYRTRREFGAFVEAARAKSDASQTAANEANRFTALVEAGIGNNVEYLLDILDGWNLDVELNAANVEQLCNELPGVAQAIVEAYQTLITTGRLGN